MPRIKLIKAKSGVTTATETKPAREWGNLTFVVPCAQHGAQFDIVCGVFVGKELADKLAERLVAAKAAGTQLSVEVEGLQLTSENGSYVNTEGERVYRTNHSIVGGKFGPVTESARTSTNADVSALAG